MLIATAVALSTILADLKGTVRICSGDECMLQVSELNTQVIRLSDAMYDQIVAGVEERSSARYAAQAICSLRYRGYSDEFLAEVRRIVRKASGLLETIQRYPSGNGEAYACPRFEP